MWSGLVDFVTWFTGTVVNPLVEMLKSVQVFEYTLFDWLIGISVVSLAIRLTRDLFMHHDTDNDYNKN